MISVNDLVAKWREYALEQVPPEYANRGIPGKYFALDNHAAGLNDAADWLEDSAAELWHPVSEPPTEDEADRSGMVLVARWNKGLGQYDFVPVKWRHVKDFWPDCRWARISDVVLMPPEGESE